jgi:S-adenosylmethionine decarboxylase
MSELAEIPPFEGPEKKLEVDFFPNPYVPRGFRAIQAPRWQVMLTLINCTIMSELKNDYCDAYLLSESSLFVYPYKVVIKTCGKITLLHCLEHLVQMGITEFQTTTSRVSFSRRNLFYPEDQLAPHNSFDDEVEYLRQHFPKGEAHIFGPRSCDHHYFFIYTNDQPNPFKGIPVAPDPTLQHTWMGSDRYQSLEILMTGMNRDVMEQFYMSGKFVSSEETTRSTGIGGLFDSNCRIDAHQFDPLGYSMNGLDEQIYYTIHITPQPECAFVSFETNIVTKDYPSLVKKVVEVFQPNCFTVLVIRDNQIEEQGYAYEGYYARNHAHHNFNNSLSHLSFFSFRQHGTISPAVRPRGEPAHLTHPNRPEVY